MNTNILLVALIALIVGAGGGYMLAEGKTVAKEEHMMDEDMMMHDHSSDMSTDMDEMTDGLSGKTGDDFDIAFISEMITHHEGAVEMANAALLNAEHDEIKIMAEAIIEAQTIEIKQLQDWQAAWYGN